ncbi:hypothetical protein M885DRAFT_45369 [Pelagophyceae sp. CCMP2097]|nr:hypothetical protein M885DRAFT_45369 [Pelagophyceae sp. CCMP2097]
MDSPLRTDVSGWHRAVDAVSDGEYVDYDVAVRCGEHKWKVSRRFNDFLRLQRDLRRLRKAWQREFAQAEAAGGPGRFSDVSISEGPRRFSETEAPRAERFSDVQGADAETTDGDDAGAGEAGSEAGSDADAFPPLPDLPAAKTMASLGYAVQTKIRGRRYSEAAARVARARRGPLAAYLAAAVAQVGRRGGAWDNAVLEFVGAVPRAAEEARRSVHVCKLPKFCKTGDLVLFRSREGLSRLQRCLTLSEWDHVAVVVQCVLRLLNHAAPGAHTFLRTPHAHRRSRTTPALRLLLEATQDGVASPALRLRLSTYDAHRIAVRRLRWGDGDLPQAQRDAMDAFAEHVDGTAYGFSAKDFVAALRPRGGARPRRQRPHYAAAKRRRRPATPRPRASDDLDDSDDGDADSAETRRLLGAGDAEARLGDGFGAVAAGWRRRAFSSTASLSAAAAPPLRRRSASAGCALVSLASFGALSFIRAVGDAAMDSSESTMNSSEEVDVDAEKFIAEGAFFADDAFIGDGGLRSPRTPPRPHSGGRASPLRHSLASPMQRETAARRKLSVASAVTADSPPMRSLRRRGSISARPLYGVAAASPQRRPPQRPKAVFCSQLTALTLQAGGVLRPDVDAAWFWPGSFASGGALDGATLHSRARYGPEILVDTAAPKSFS